MPDLKLLAMRLGRIESFILCARETAKAANINESSAIADVLLHVQNALYDVRLALDPALSGDDDTNCAEATHD